MAWHYDGSGWTDHPPTQYAHAEVDAAALGGNGILYLAGSSGVAQKGIVLSYDGSQWTDLSPAGPPSGYQALAVTADGTLIAAGGGRGDGTLQEKSGATWTTVSLSAPVNAITKVSVTPDGTVYGAGSVAGNAPVLIRQPPGSGSATVLDPSAAGRAATLTSKSGVAALGLDVWLLGEGEPHEGWHHPWFTFGDRDFDGGWHRFGQVAIGRSAVDARSGRPCWSTAQSRAALDRGVLRLSSWCGRPHRRSDKRRSGCRWPGQSLPQDDSYNSW